MQPGLFQFAGAAGGDDAVGAVYGCAREHRDQALFKKYRSAKDYAAISQEELEKDIQSTGFYRNKAKAIRGMAAELIEKYRGEVPRTMEELHGLPGVGRKTANVVLGNAFETAVGVTVDTHVTRLSNRLGLTSMRAMR